MANYVGGTADLIGPFDTTTGVLGPEVSSTTRLANVSLMHMVNSDHRCGASAHLVGCDADYHGIAIIDPASAVVKGVVKVRERPRRLVYHPTLKDVAYAVFEEVGKVAGVRRGCSRGARHRHPPSCKPSTPTRPPTLVASTFRPPLS